MRSLQVKQEEFTSITENMSEGFLVLDSNTDILSYHNTSVLRLLGGLLPGGKPWQRWPEPQRWLPQRSGRERPGRGAAAVTASAERPLLQVMANPVLPRTAKWRALWLVLDITEQEEHENLRREFANVSTS